MIKNYFKIAWRNFTRHKGFTAINVAGLGIGLACSLLLALYVKDELSYDKHHVNAEQIYRLSRTFLSKEGEVSLRLGHAAPPFGPLIRQDFHEVKEVVRLLETGALVRYREKTFEEEKMFAAEPSLFKIFTVNVLQGNAEKALENPFSIMFSRPMAEKYFGKENPLGKTIRLDNQIDYQVTGVFEPFPQQSTFHPNFLVSFSTLADDKVYGAEQLRTNWGNNSFSTFLLLSEGQDPKKIVDAFPAFQNRHIDPKASEWSVLDLMKLTDIHLHSHLDSEIESNGDIQYVYLFSAIAIFILIIACINYMNLSTASSGKRSKEVGMRKVAGAGRSQLIYQFMSESFLIVGMSLLIALFIMMFCLPFLNDITQKQLSISSLADPLFIVFLAVVCIVTSLIAGSYPAFVLTSFEPVKALKGKITGKAKSGNLRQVLVVTQFTIAVVLIISTVIVYSQMEYIQNYKLGLSKDQMVVLRLPETQTGFETIRQELQKSSAVQSVGRSSRIPSNNLLDSWNAYVTKNKVMTQTNINIKSLQVDEDFIPTYKIKMASGRNFSKAFPSDTEKAFILNETAVKLLGWQKPENAIGENFRYGELSGQIIGVTKDYHFESLHKEVAPIVMFMNGRGLGWTSVQISGGNINEALARVEDVWKKYFPDSPFKYEFLDQRFGRLYTREQTQQLVFGFFAGIAVFISCLGLLGLSIFMAELRIKEIGVRKVLGASVTSLVSLLSKDFLLLVIIAIVIASPLAWYGMNWWLKDFAYKTPIRWSVFAFAGALAVGIAFMTVSFQSIKAALTNPVKSLKSE